MTGDRSEEHDDHPRDEDPVGGARTPEPKSARDGGDDADPSPAEALEHDADEFLLELDDLDDDLLESVSVSDDDDPLGLDGLFDREAPAPVSGEQPTDDYDDLFDGTGEGAAAETGFAGARPAPEFVEDHAGWLGDDVDLGSMVGESVARARDEGLKFDPNDREEDPFELDEIEVEHLDWESDTDEAGFEALEFVIDEDEGVDTEDVAAPDLGLVPDASAADTVDEQIAFLDPDPAPVTAAAADEAFEFDLELDPDADLASDDAATGDDSWAPLTGASASGPMLSETADEAVEPVAENQEFDFSGFAAEVEAARAAADRPAPTASDWSNSDFTIDEDEAPVAEEESFTAAGFGLEGRRDEPAWGRAKPELAEWNEAPADDSEAESDPIYGDLQGEDGAFVESPEGAWDADAAHAADVEAELSELVADAPPAPLRVVGGWRVGNRAWRRWAAAAVLLVTVGGAGVAVVPEWFGLASTTPTVEPVVVKRPRIDVNLPPPIDPVEVPEPPVELPIDPPVVVDGGPVDPAIDPPIDPPIEVPPLDPLLTGTDGPPVPPVEQPPAVAITPNFSPMMIGEFLEIVAVDSDGAQGGTGTLPIGTRALALMRNDEIFIGVVRSMDAVNVTLDLEPGEVSLALASMTRIQPLNSAASDETIEAERGFVRLKNLTRFYGRVLRDPEDGTLIVQGDRNRIVLRQDEVSSYGSAGTSQTNVVLEDDDEWLDERVRRQLDQMGRGGVPKPDGSGANSEGTTSTQTVVPSTPARGGR